jgi:hypothetical protein
MLIAGGLLLVLASVASTWSTLNLKRPPMMRAPVYRNGGVLLIFSEWVVGAGASILVGLATTMIVGLVAFAVFWFSPRFLGPIFVAFGLWREPPI